MVNSPEIDQGGTIVGGASEAEGVEQDDGYARGVRVSAILRLSPVPPFPPLRGTHAHTRCIFDEVMGALARGCDRWV